MTQNDDEVGTLRRGPGLVHAILLDQGGEHRRWFVVDAYGPLLDEDLYTDEEVQDWPVVYLPEDYDEFNRSNFNG